MSSTYGPFVRRALTPLAAIALVFCTSAAGAAVGDFTGLPFFNYQYGVTKAGSETNSWLTAQYNDWKAHYVVDQGYAAKVMRDGATHHDTVSEGMAYGMLLAVYFNDKATFDKLYVYVKEHLSGTRDDPINLMHWKVAASDEDISEFRLTTPHDKAYLFLPDAINNVPEELRTYMAGDPGQPDTWIRASIWDRKAGSATDADLDMAAALVLAHYRWGGAMSSGDLYAVEAATMIVHIAEYDTIGSPPGVFLRNGTLWGGEACWNPSYYGPAWLRLFVKFVTATQANVTVGPIYDLPNRGAAYYVTRLNALIQNMDAEMLSIQAFRGGSTILFPDWVDTTGSGMGRPTCSDRRYYLDEDGDGQIDDRNGNGVIDDGGTMGIDRGDGYNLLSFNYYYDAVRIPWRIGTDYSWYGSESSQAINQKIGSFFKPKRFYVPQDETPDPYTDLVDGYAFHGGSWMWPNRDGFNPNPGGVNNSVTFVNFSSAASMSMDSTLASACYRAMKSKGIEPYENEYHYFGNVARMLNLLYMNGKLTRPNRTVMIKSRSNGLYVTASNPLTANDSSGNAGLTWFDLINLGNDRVALVHMQMTKDSQGPNQPTVTAVQRTGGYLYAVNDPTAPKGKYETFRVTRHSGGDISLRCDGNSKYVRVRSNGQLVADQSANTSTSTRFYLEYKQEY